MATASDRLRNAREKYNEVNQYLPDDPNRLTIQQLREWRRVVILLRQALEDFAMEQTHMGKAS